MDAKDHVVPVMPKSHAMSAQKRIKQDEMKADASDFVEPVFAGAPDTKCPPGCDCKYCFVYLMMESKPIPKVLTIAYIRSIDECRRNWHMTDVLEGVSPPFYVDVKRKRLGDERMRVRREQLAIERMETEKHRVREELRAKQSVSASV